MASRVAAFWNHPAGPKTSALSCQDRLNDCDARVCDVILGCLDALGVACFGFGW